MLDAKPGYPGFILGGFMKIAIKLLFVTILLFVFYVANHSFDSQSEISSTDAVGISRPLLEADFAQDGQIKLAEDTPASKSVISNTGDTEARSSLGNLEAELSLGEYIDPEDIPLNVSDTNDINIGDYVDPEELPPQNDSFEEISIGAYLDTEDLLVSSSSTEEINIGPALDPDEEDFSDSEETEQPTVTNQLQIIP